jgi:hypothetical protein
MHSPGVDEKTRAFLSAILVFVSALLYFLPISLLELDPYDEAIRVYGAQQVLRGERPYQDFYAIYGPGEFYLPAGLFALFGTEIFYARLALAAVNAATALVVFLILRQMHVGRPWTIGAMALFLVPRHAAGALLYACGPAVLLVMAACLAAKRDCRGPGLPWRMGVLIGLAGLFRHDFCAYATLAGFLTVLVCRPTLSADPLSPAPRWSHRIRRALAVPAVVAAVALPVYSLVAWPHPDRVVANLLVYPGITAPYRSAPFPWAEIGKRLAALASLGSTTTVISRTALMEFTPALPLLMPLLAPLLLAAWAWPRARRRLLADASVKPSAVYLATLAAGLSCYGLMRSGLWHLFPLYVVLLSLTLAVAQASLQAVSPRLDSWVGTALACAAVLAVGWIGAGRWRDYRSRTPVELARARGIVTIEPDGIAAYRQAVEDLQQYPEGPVFVGATRHDRVSTNPILLYFVANRSAGTYYHHFDPGVTDVESFQREIVAQLDASGVQAAILWKVDLPEEPSRSRTAPGSTVLDVYLRSHFERVRARPLYELWERRAHHPPASAVSAGRLPARATTVSRPP